MKGKLLQVTLYANPEVYTRASPHCGEITDIMLDKLINNKYTEIKVLYKYYNITLKQIEYQYVEINRLKTRL